MDLINMGKNKLHSKTKNKHYGLDVKAIPVPKGWEHPDPPNEILPRHEFTMGLIAPKGSGKTTLIANLLDFYKGYFHTILVFSPTVHSDEKWDYVKNQDLLAENVLLKNWLKEMAQKESENKVVQDAPPGRELEGLVNPKPMDDFKIPEECFYEDYDEETLLGVMEEQMAIVTMLKKHGMGKFMANRLLIVFDDLVGSSLFSAKKQSPFKGLNTRHRHYSCSMLIVTQGYMEIPKTVRINYSCLIVFEIPNEKEIAGIQEENPMYISKQEWYNLYEHAVEGDYSFLYINYQKPKMQRMMKNFSNILFIDL